MVAAGVAIETAPAQAPARVEGDADLEAARQAARNNAQAIMQVKLARTTEPAVHFKV